MSILTLKVFDALLFVLQVRLTSALKNQRFSKPTTSAAASIELPAQTIVANHVTTKGLEAHYVWI